MLSRATSMPMTQTATAAKAAGLGSLPEWDLSHLYPTMDGPEFKADLARAESACREFAKSHRGTLADVVARPDGGQALYAILQAYEGVEDLLGRLMSFAGLVYSGETTDPQRAKFYGDTQERLTAASSDLLFFTLELNRIDDALLDGLMAKPPLSHYRPWLEDIRRDKPHQLDDKLEQLFHEKSVTGRSAWNRLFDETIAVLALHVRGEELPIEPTLNKLQDPDETCAGRLRRARPRPSRPICAPSRSSPNPLQGQGNLRPLARLPGRGDSRHLANRVEREVVEALVSAVREAYPRLSHRYYALKAGWFGKDKLDHWDRNAPLPRSSSAPSPGTRRGRRSVRLFGLLAPHGRYRAALLRRELDRRSHAPRQGPGGLRPSHRSLGASLCAPELSGKAQGRDDAGP
jgi:oligoendopeptidase F